MGVNKGGSSVFCDHDAVYLNTWTLHDASAFGGFLVVYTLHAYVWQTGHCSRSGHSICLMVGSMLAAPLLFKLVSVWLNMPMHLLLPMVKSVT